jgi:hypothetical protein
MKTQILLLLVALTFAIGNLKAEDRIRVNASSYDISDNLDLEAVASIFGKSKNLADFERRLNNAGSEISNLDLNEDGYVDYLRVIEVSDNGDRLVIVQAILGEDIFQDVASLELKRNFGNRYSVVLIGNDFLYGPGFYLEPVYYRNPSIFDYFFSTRYTPWHSPYYWGYYPRYYSYRRPYPVHRYRSHIHVHIDNHNHYNYHDSYKSHYSSDFYHKSSRNDYGSIHPERSFEKRNDGYKNKHELIQNRRSSTPNTSGYNNNEKSTRSSEYQNRRSEPAEKSKKAYQQSAPAQETSGSSRRESTQPTPYKSKNTESTEPQKVERKPMNRESSAPVQVKRRSESTNKPSPEKVQRQEPAKSKSVERKSETKVKTEPAPKKVEKSSSSDTKKKENGSRR